MEKGKSHTTNYVINYIGESKLKEVEQYITSILSTEFLDSTNPEFQSIIQDLYEKTIPKLSSTDQSNLRIYTGYHFRSINSVLRGSWSYENNGPLTPEIQKDSYEQAEQIRKALNKASSLSKGIKTYRGVSIEAFYSYNIASIQDLPYLNGNYLYEAAFTSTSIDERSCFFYKKPFTLNSSPDILVEYLIPENSDDGLVLLDESTSYSKDQQEFIINSSSLFKVLDVELSPDKKKAYMKVLLIPEKIWNYPDYERERNASITR